MIEYQSGRWLFIGGLAMFVLFGLAAAFPDVGNPSGSSKSRNMPPGAAALLFGSLALGGVIAMIGSFPHHYRFAVDGRGMWWRAGRKSDLIAWEELRAVRGQEPRPPGKRDPNSKPVLPLVVFTPVDPRFATRHAAMVKGPPVTAPEVALRLPSFAKVQELTEAIGRVRPDLVH